MSQMWCKQHPTCSFLQYVRHITNNCPSSHAPPDGLYPASRPTVLSVPVSRKLLGGRANKQDKQHSHRPAPTRHRGNLGLHRTRTLRRRPRPQHYTSSHILRRRNRRHDIRILLRLDLRNLVGAWRLSRGSIRHRILNRRRNLRARQRVPPPVWQRRILDTILRHRSTPLHRLPSRHPSRTLWDSILLGTRKN